MRCASFEALGRASHGLLRSDEIVDLGKRSGAQAPHAESLADGRASNRGPTSCRRRSRLPIGRRQAASGDPATESHCLRRPQLREHRAETQRDPTEHPSIFLRNPQSPQGAGQPLLRPIESTQLDYEGALAVVIGKPGRRIKEADAWTHIAGVSCFNEGSVRDWQHHMRQFVPGKNFVKTGAFGPCLVTLDGLPADRVLSLTTRVNGRVVQHASTDQMIFPIPRILAYVSTFLALVPGDVIVTGTPGGVGVKRNPQLWLKPGDSVEVEISSVGLLVNSVESEA